MGPGICIAIDGPASSGKGTVARRVAKALGYAYVDTGAMYRSVALVALERGVPLEDGLGLGALAASLRFGFAWSLEGLRVIVDGRDVSSRIRAEAVGQAASAVATRPEVRSALLALQRELGAAGGVVMDGRDIGTVILPAAELKVYLDASVDERARRRHAELCARGVDVRYGAVRAELHQRDAQDKQRDVAPLRRAEDAVLIDSTGLEADAVVRAVLQLAHERGAVAHPV
ncbi:MAG: (d)CMP kinase [Myxococcota bacterium]|nr:(d)CMP kinase [Myxococcota bacterium]